MGLDSIWIMPDETGEEGDDKLPYFDPELRLITGMLLACPRSFRGKTYNALIESITGVSLYQEDIPNPVIKEMAEALDAWIPEEHLRDLSELLDIGYANENIQHYNDLKRMFRAFADAGALLHGWW